MNAPSPRAVTAPRWDAIDVARGVAIVAMVVYHTSWDLSFLRLAPLQVVGEPGWNWFARGIAGSFLALVGIGLAFAHAGGFKRRSFLVRLAKIAGAALAVTIVTRVVFPQSYIFFGILHCIAVSSVLALPFRRLPTAVVLGTTALVLAAPQVLTQPAFDGPFLDWLGLGAEAPVTNDYVPLFPWFGIVLLGLAAGRFLVERGGTLSLARWRSRNPAARALAFMGCKSLPIYLIHQPLIFGALYGVLMLTGPNQTAAFVGQCRADCVAQSGNPAMCRQFCPCVADTLKRSGDFARVMANELDAANEARVKEAAQICLRRPPS